MTIKQKMLDAIREQKEKELSELKPGTNEYWEKEESLRLAELEADGHAEDSR